MKPEPPAELQAQAAGWEDLTRWERAELGRALRRLGWSYGETRALIPVPKGTLSNWCREIRLADQQVAAIKERTGRSAASRETPNAVVAERSSTSVAKRPPRSRCW